jgi:hypothetical protein
MMGDTYDWEKAWAKPEPTATVIPLPPITSNGSTAYGIKALADELRILANTGEGARNHQLNTAAFNLAQLVAAGHLDGVETQQQLRATALMIGLTASETDGTLRSAFKAGTQLPRVVPELEVNYTVEYVEPQIDPETGEQINPSTAAEQTTVDRRYLELSGAVLNLEGLRNIPPPTPLIEGYIFRDTLAWLGGKPGHAKSFVAVEIACCIATGTPWHSHAITGAGTVLYLIAEGASGLSQRVDAWTINHNKPADNVLFLPVPVQMADTYSVDVAAFSMLLKTLQPVLVVIDTQARVTVGADENSSKDMGKFVHSLELLRMYSKATMLIVHHEPRNGENLRGSTALEGAANTIIRVSKDGDLVTLSNPKQKDSVEREPMNLALEARGESAVLVRSGIAHRKAAATESGRLILETLAGFGPDGAASTALMEATALPKKTFYRNINDLVSDGLVLRRKVGNATIYKIAPPPEDDDQ